MTVDHRPRGLAESGGGGGVGGLGLRNCSALNRHVHYHCCVIDGVFEPVEKADDVPQAVRFRAAADLTPEAVATIAEQVRVRVLRWFARSGLIAPDQPAHQPRSVHRLQRRPPRRAPRRAISG